MNLIKILLLSIVLLCGCDVETRTWEIEMYQPNGALHSKYTITQWQYPRVYAIGGGVTAVGYIRAPIGWLLVVGDEVK